jgi:DNA-binding IscR family transcriptional regulator
MCVVQRLDPSNKNPTYACNHSLQRVTHQSTLRSARGSQGGYRLLTSPEWNYVAK